MASRSGALALAATLLAAVLSATPATAAEEANAPTVTGETGLFTLLAGDTLPRGGWSFGLYYNNWDRVYPLTGPFPGEPGVPSTDPSLDPITALLSSPRRAGDFDTILLPTPDRLTSDPNDDFDLGIFPLLGGPPTRRDFFTEIFTPSNTGLPQRRADQARPAKVDILWQGSQSSYDLGYGFFFAGGVDANASWAGRSLFDVDGNGRHDDVYPGQILIQGSPADVRATPVVENNAQVMSARRSRLRFLPVCGGSSTLYRGQFRGTVMFDSHKGSRAARRAFRRHIGGSLATNASITSPPQLGRTGSVAFEFAGCGKGSVQVFSTFRSLGLPPVVHGLKRKVAAQLVDVRVDGRRVVTRYSVRTARQRAVRRSPLWPKAPRGSRRDQVGLLMTIKGKLDRKHSGSVALGRRLTIKPRRRAVRFVKRCLRRGGTPRLVKRRFACRRR